MEFDLLITDALVVTMNSEHEVYSHGAVGVKGNQIAFVGDTSNVENKEAAKKVIDARGQIVLPGFINCHTHGIQVLLRGGLSQDKSLMDWLLNVLLPGLSFYQRDDASIAARLYCVESIRSGITTFLDNADASQSSDIVEATLEAYLAMGIRAVYGRMFLDKMPELPGDYMSALQDKHGGIPFQRDFHEETKAGLKRIESLIAKHHQGPDGLIQIWPAPAMPMFVTKEGLLGSLSIAQEYDTGITIHLAESRNEHLAHQMSPVEYLACVGFLNERVVAAHCVHVNTRDLRILKQHSVRVVTLPVSNLYLGSGIAPIPDMVECGLEVGIGTDDANCNDSVSMLAEMKFLALIHRGIREDAAVITSERILEMATIGGARTLGMENFIGSIEIGKKADIIIFDRDVPQLVPLHHVPSVIVYQAYGSEVRTTIVDGKILMENYQLTALSREEEADLFRSAQLASEKIIQRAGLIKRDWVLHNF